MGLRDRLDRIENEANETMRVFRALLAEIRNGFRVKLRFKFVGPVTKFFWLLAKSIFSKAEPNWNREFPDGLPIEVDAQIFIEE